MTVGGMGFIPERLNEFITLIGNAFGALCVPPPLDADGGKRRPCLQEGLELLLGERHWHLLCGKLVPHPGFRDAVGRLKGLSVQGHRSQEQAQPDSQ